MSSVADDDSALKNLTDDSEFEKDWDSITLKAELAMEAIEKLSPAYRTVFNLYVLENYTHKEIGELLGISEGTSKSNLSKAKVNLQYFLKNKFRPIES
jgi:RNA polymerase sigma-70 factor (ECF subfamily)